ncbi:hypothetical protein VSS37_00010 [Candidatus Thiothrix sp. Deng01]|uniref:Uncharacterized protein n=1 Tax=Candidatus Thiothrix phosphatis TaxID=3112415 RepID=A0ABU6CS39_9GAMM|nr:hypothetical protein [Candidatus Thiothrix sp. Deng01]MEB4589352.1 hypothetical protein [Candidatus Thiothrix sp. Deng01]
MALRDWLTLDLSQNRPEITKSRPEITGITKSHPEITTDVINQAIENKGNTCKESQNHKNHCHKHTDLKNVGLKRLEAAAAGLPIQLNELEVIFADDLEDFGGGAVSIAGIRQACEFYAMGRPQPQRGEIPAGMVRCTDCQQDRCKHKRVTPWGSVERQSSPQWRWCSDYNPLDSNVTAFRGKPCASK